MPAGPDVVGLINRLYDTIQSPEDWPAGLAAVADEFGSHTSHVLYVPDPAGPPILNAASAVTSPARAEEYYRDYVPIDPRLPHFPNYFGKAIRCVDVLPIDAMERSALIPFLDNPEVNARWCLVAPFQVRPGEFGFVSTLRARASGTWSDQDVLAFEALSPHFRRIVELHMRLGALSARAEAGEAALHALPSGVILTDDAARVMFVNHVAETLLRQGVIHTRGSRLVCPRPSDTTELHKNIHSAASARDSGEIANNSLILRRPASTMPIIVLTLPLPFGYQASVLGTRAQVAIFLIDPSREGTISNTLLRKLGFTPAEARLAAALASGSSLTEYVDQYGITRETARSHLAQLMRKTDTNRQVELVMFLSRCLSVALGTTQD